jgi:hypothetical protein
MEQKTMLSETMLSGASKIAVERRKDTAYRQREARYAATERAMAEHRERVNYTKTRQVSHPSQARL